MAVRENEIARDIVDAAFKVHRALGPGLLESVYERVLAYELQKRGHHVEVQEWIAVEYEDLLVEEAYRADIIVDRCVLVETKSLEQITKLHQKQTNTYIRLANFRLGLLINFNVLMIKDGIHRVVNGLPDE